MSESIQKKLTRVRPPRVKITYEVETGGAIEKQELPFIVGILADVQGETAADAQVQPLNERRFVDIDRDSFDDVLRKIGPGVNLYPTLPGLDVLKGSDDPDDSYLGFSSLADFDPLSVVRAVPALREIYLARTEIRWVQSKVETSSKVAAQLQGWLKFDVSADNTETPKVRELLSAALAGPALADADRTALLASLTKLELALRKLDVAQERARTAADQAAAKADVESARAAAVPVLAEWNLTLTGTDKDADERALAQGDLLAGALALPDTPENRGEAAKLVKLLAEAPAPDSTDPTVKARDAARQEAVTSMSIADPAAARAIAADLQPLLDSDSDAERSKGMTTALFLAGLRGDNSAGEVKKPATPDVDPVRRKYLNDCVTAAGRGVFLSLAHYLHQGTPEARLMTGELMRLIEALRPGPVVRVPAIVQRLKYFVTQIVAPWQKDDKELLKLKPRGLGAVIDKRVAQIDAQLSAALSSIMHMPAFRALESSWRGLHYLVSRSETGTMLKLRLLNATKAELLKDLETAVEFDQSMLFKHIYEAEYGTLGGSPYSLMVGDYAIDGSAQDIEFVTRMAEVAAAAHAPFISAASPQLFGLENFDDLAHPRDLSMVFSHQELEPWREFRELEDSRYVTLVLPRVLLRLPYGKAEKRNTIPCDGLNFEEQVGATLPVTAADGSVAWYPRPESDNFLWGNAAYVLAERITNAFSLYSWTAAIRGVEGGGLVEGLPAYSYASDLGTVELFCPTEVTITDRREKELSDLGFMSLCHYKGTATAAFFGGQTTNSPKTYFSNDANANARLSAMLPYMLAASRFAHYIKVIMRKKIGTFMTRGNVESFLNNWIANYVLLDDNAPQDAKAAFPLRAANVVATEVPGAPGTYNATVFLRPHFQLEELSTSIRLVAKLPG
jgi:type VI secretion system ImpC/EvpB family protein/type VI secretion system ImpB/VipA family protein